MKLYFIAGEASGDLHGANLARAIRLRVPEAELRGMGGDRMQAAGVHLVRHNAQDNHMGILEVLRHLPSILALERRIQQDLLDWRPDAIVLIDYPGFNLRLARFCKAQGIRVFYYISPQVWAWKSGRVKQLQAYCDRIYTILPFEQAWFAQRGVQVEYYGHPLLDAVAAVQAEPNTLRSDLGIAADRPVLALLPGSRGFEIRNMLPAMLRAVAPFAQTHQIVVAGAPNQTEAAYKSAAQAAALTLPYPVVFGRTYDILRAAHAAVVTSGTATLETALFGVPQLMCYKANPVTYFIGRRLVDIKFAALPNLILDRELIVELWQGRMNAANIGAELQRLLHDPARRAHILAGYAELRDMLGHEGASQRVADAMLARLYASG